MTPSNDSSIDDSMAPEAIVMFAKAPVAGRVKTRLAPALGEQGAARLHRAFLLDLGQRLESVCAHVSQRAAYLAYAGDRDHEVFEQLAAERGLRRLEQSGADLGARLEAMSARCLAGGVRKLLIIGSDSPTLPSAMLEEAFVALDRVDVVLSPSFDGGYTLIGCREHLPSLFEAIPWSSEEVLGRTLRRVAQSERLCELLGFWYDIDTSEDLRHLYPYLLPDLTIHELEAAPATTALLREMWHRGELEGLAALGDGGVQDP